MRLRLILSFALIVLVSVTSVVVIARSSAAQAVRAFMFRGGMTGVEGLVDTLEAYYGANQTWQGAEELLLSPHQGPGRGRGGQGMGQGMMGSGMMNQRLRLAGPDGILLADTADPNPSGRLSPGELQGAIPLLADGETVGYLLPEGGMAFSRSDELALVDRLNRAALTAGLIAGGVALLIALLLAHSLLRPVQALTAAAGRLAQGDLSQRVAAGGRDELATLGRTFNQMAAALQQAEGSRRAMTADIAHELRTPLAVQRAHLEALQDGIYALTPENLAPIQEQNLLLARLVDDLRTLALADAGQLPLERKPTDFTRLVKQVVERFRRQAEEQGIQVELETGSSTTTPSILSIDPLRVEQILGNLLSNALRYTPEGGCLKIAVSLAPEHARLTVHDSGPGIPAEALPHVFERFYRADRSRSRMEGGTGLGLAIARQLAEAHGGSLTAANHLDGGAVFELTLPQV